MDLCCWLLALFVLVFYGDRNVVPSLSDCFSRDPLLCTCTRGAVLQVIVDSVLRVGVLKLGTVCLCWSLLFFLFLLCICCSWLWAALSIPLQLIVWKHLLWNDQLWLMRAVNVILTPPVSVLCCRQMTGTFFLCVAAVTWWMTVCVKLLLSLITLIEYWCLTQSDIYCVVVFYCCSLWSLFTHLLFLCHPVLDRLCWLFIDLLLKYIFCNSPSKNNTDRFH